MMPLALPIGEMPVNQDSAHFVIRRAKENVKPG